MGIYSFARGCFGKPPIDGNLTSAPTLYRVRSGQFIYSRLFAFEGAYAVVPDELDGAFVSNEFPCFDVQRDRVLPRYLRWMFLLPKVWAALAEGSKGMGDRRKRVHPDQLLAFRAALPPLEVQRRIVERLDAVEAKLRQIDRIRQEAQAEVRVLIARALAAIVDRYASRETCPLGDLVDAVGGGTPTRNIPAFWDGTIPWVTAKDMKALVISDAQQRITREGLNASPAKLLPQNAVLVVVRGMILARFVPIALLSVPATINQDMKALIARPPLSSEFLLAWLIANERTLFQRVGKSTHDTRKLESVNLLSLLVPTLTPAEQARFVDDFQRLRANTSALEQRMEAVVAEAEQILPTLLAEAFGDG
ncbi:restriction endonuclease subunit S [Leptolyngbya sp. 15MV]|nr:restriction endonuclease subunit S [Leptolyngbya sp. 15MV]